MNLVINSLRSNYETTRRPTIECYLLCNSNYANLYLRIPECFGGEIVKRGIVGETSTDDTEGVAVDTAEAGATAAHQVDKLHVVLVMLGCAGFGGVV